MKFLFVYVLLISCLSLKISAQQTNPLPHDNWQWTTVSIDKKINKKWSVGVDEELRLMDNMSRVNLFFTNVGPTFKLSKHFKFSLTYRFINKNQLGYYSQRHRLYLDSYFKSKYKNFSFTYRLRFQAQVRDYFSSLEGKYPECYMRNKFDFDYSIGNFTPYLAAEFRMQFTNPQFEYANDELDRYRLYAGCDYDINKKNSVGIYFMNQKDFNNKNAQNNFVFGLKYGLSL